MEHHKSIAVGLALSAVLIVGCATSPSDTRVSSPTQAADRAFQYRQQADELNRMAERLEAESQWYAQQGGQDSEQAKKARDMAANLRTSAQEAEQKAEEYRRQVPHNQIF